MYIIPIVIIYSGLIFSFLQVVKIMHFRKSKMNFGWFVSVTFFMIILTYIGLNSGASIYEQTLFFTLLAVALWSNTVKFTLGLIQKRELTLYNRFEHMATGVLAVYGLSLIHFTDIFPIIFLTNWASSLFLLMIVNMISVGIEIGELAVDLYLGKIYMIGPSVHDTNWDLFCTFIGSLLGFVLLVALN